MRSEWVELFVADTSLSSRFPAEKILSVIPRTPSTIGTKVAIVCGTLLLNH